MFLSNADECLSNVDEPKMFTVYPMLIQITVHPLCTHGPIEHCDLSIWADKWLEMLCSPEGQKM